MSVVSKLCVATLALATFVATTPEAHTQSPEEKAAAKAFKGDTKAQLKTFKTVSKAAFTDVLNALKDFESDPSLAAEFNAITIGNAGAHPVTKFSDALNQFAKDLVTAVENALLGAVLDAAARLDTLAGGVAADLNGALPDGFYAADGGALDKLQAQIQKTADKYYLQLEKKLTKSCKKIEKATGVAITVRARNPIDVYVAAPEGGSSASRPLTIDHFLTASMAGVALDGEDPVADAIICAGGMCDQLKLDPNARIVDNEAVDFEGAAALIGTAGRWRFCSNKGGLFFGEGNYRLEIYQDGGFAVPSNSSLVQFERIYVGVR